MDFQNESLQSLRNELDLVNDHTMKLFERRHKIISEIMSFKKSTESFVWDPERELSIFKKFASDLSDQRVSSLLSLSFLMEIQAVSVNPEYPRWSQKEHISSSLDSYSETINPVLLMLINETEYQKLILKENYKTLLKDIE